jgi:ABC-type sugar transport system ATPase subunit
MRGIGKRFGGVEALSNISLSVRSGEVHALIGENGAGKSTLGKVLAGSIQPDRGTLLINGRSVSYRSPRDAIRDGVTLIGQERMLVQTRSVGENVFLGAEHAKTGIVSRRRLEGRYRKLCRRVGFELSASADVRGIRRAEQLQVEVLRALARDADLFVFDEPTAGLTHDEATHLRKVVGRLTAQGATVLYISHSLEEVILLADTISVVRTGRIVETVPKGSATVESLVSAMLGRSLDLTFSEKPALAGNSPVVLSARKLGGAGQVEDVSFDVRRGEILGITGLVGSGCSQLVRLLVGADRYAQGTIYLDGQPATIRSPREAIRHGIVLLPEARERDGLMMHRSIVENVALPHLRETSRAGVLRRRHEVVRTAELIGRLDVRTPALRSSPAMLSGGNQQKVLFAKWLFRQPRVLIADEPTRGIDVGAKRTIYEFLRSLVACGMSLVLVSSEVEEVLGLAHRVLVMRGGHLVAELDGSTAHHDDIIRAALGVGLATGEA